MSSSTRVRTSGRQSAAAPTSINPNAVTQIRTSGVNVPTNAPNPNPNAAIESISANNNLPGALAQNDDVLPQHPFWPQGGEALGPQFLDTHACLCALRPVDIEPEGSIYGTQAKEVAWQCIGEQKLGVYATRGGKWFRTDKWPDDKPSVGLDADNPIWDASHPPNWNVELIYDEKTDGLRAWTSAEKDAMDIHQRICSGQNETTFSTAFYRVSDAIKRNDTSEAHDAFPCYKVPGLPLKLQNEDSWLKEGCNEGFLCKNNTVNSLPVFCPPVELCGGSRLSGEICKLNGKNLAMGPFEPVICQEGWYCPEGGKETIICPKGTYCQPGTLEPTPCAIASYCPEGSISQQLFVPVAVWILLNAGLILAALILACIKRRKDPKHKAKKAAKADNNNIVRRMTKKVLNRPVRPTPGGKYGQLDDDENSNGEDHEMLAMDATYMPSFNRQDTYIGFQAALEARRSGEDQHQQLNPQLKAFVDSMRKATDASSFGLSFRYKGLTFHPKGRATPILQNITGTIERGSLAAVMGGSGAGKSTFVNVLMGKTDNTGGTVMVNNVPGKLKRYKKLIGYVPQDDIVLPELTVYENIAHSARCRLPRTWSDNDIDTHVNAIIDCLEMSHVRDSLVGSVGKPVISGGQRKRVSIGMELAAAPMAIFLDEPTSGLDATAASSIMRTLKAIARLGISVIVIIHQPRMEIFEMLDNLILLGNGQTIYEGPESDVIRYFSSCGFQFPPHANAGDVITDIITGHGRNYKKSGDISKEALINHWANCRQSLDREDAVSTQYDRSSPTLNIPGSGTDTPHGRSRSRSQNSSSSTLAPRPSSVYSLSSSEATANLSRTLRTRGAPRIKQFVLCLRRAMLQQYRAKGAFFAEVGLASLAGFLLGIAHNGRRGVLFKGIHKPPYELLSTAIDYQSAPQLALLICICIGLVASAPGVRVFSEEMLLHRREAEAGHSRVAYFMAKVVSVIPRMMIACFNFTATVWMFTMPIIPWWTMFGANLAYFYCIYGLAAVVSMIARREDAPLFATMVSLVVAILSGASPTLRQVKEWKLEWLWRMGPGVWLAELYFGQLVGPFEYLYLINIASDFLGFALNQLSRNVGLLLAIGTAYRLLAYFGLVFGGRLRV